MTSTPEIMRIAIHQGKEQWAEEYGMDTNYIAATQDKLS